VNQKYAALEAAKLMGISWNFQPSHL